MAFNFDDALAEVRRKRAEEAERVATRNSKKQEKIGDLYRQFEIFKGAHNINVKATIKDYTINFQKSTHSLLQITAQDDGLFSSRTVDPGGSSMTKFNDQDLAENEVAAILADWSTL